MLDQKMFTENPKKFIEEKERQMEDAVRELDFETAALLRDEIAELIEKSGVEIESFQNKKIKKNKKKSK